MVRVGLTGGIASGKSAVAQMLADRGAVIIDADVLAREVVEPGQPALDAIVARFGPVVLLDDGSLDRAKLGEIIFGDAAARADLNAIVHPAVRAAGRALDASAADDEIVVHVIPLLVETGQSTNFDLVVVVDVEEETQIERMRRRNGLTVAQAQARIDAQAPRADRASIADVLIDNSGTLAQTAEQVDHLWNELLAMNRPKPV